MLGELEERILEDTIKGSARLSDRITSRPVVQELKGEEKPTRLLLHHPHRSHGAVSSMRGCLCERKVYREIECLPLA